jgi:cell division septal protein FtsQ
MEMVKNNLAVPSSPLRRFATVVFVFAIFFLLMLAIFETGKIDPLLQSLSVFKIEEVRVRSEWPLSPSTVKGWLPTLEQTSLLVLRPRELILGLRERPWVENVAIKKEFPSRILIDVETKRPQAISLHNGQMYFVDSHGQIIEKVSAPLLKVLDLPFVSFEKDSKTWNMPEFLSTLEKMKEKLGKDLSVSQFALGTHPYFKLFLTRPRVEVLMSFENWEPQLEILLRLVNNPPRQVGQLQRINLTLPKKAVVSSPKSH